MMKTIFWNVDTQYDFMRDDDSHRGALAIPGAKDIEKNLEKLTRLAAAGGFVVVNTADWHTPESAEFSDAPDYLVTFPPHCLIGTKGARFVPATAPEPAHAYELDWSSNFDEGGFFHPGLVNFYRNIVIYKDTFDVFRSPFADTVLDLIKPGRAVVYGVAADVCVDYAVRGLRDRQIDVIVPRDAVKGLPGTSLDEIFARWKDSGVILSTTDEIEISAKTEWWKWSR